MTGPREQLRRELSILILRNEDHHDLHLEDVAEVLVGLAVSRAMAKPQETPRHIKSWDDLEDWFTGMMRERSLAA